MVRSAAISESAGTSTQPKTGLVLSGGGALGAYHAGVVRALSELDVPVHMVSGASVGALNGAVVATSPSLDSAACQLDRLWRTLGSQSPLHPHVPGWFQLLLGTGMDSAVLQRLTSLLGAAAGLGPIGAILSRVQDEIRLFTNSPIRQILNDVLSDAELETGLPLFVSVFRSRGGVIDLLAGVAKVLELNTPPSEFLHIQALSPEERHEAILASAALPLVFGSQEVGGQRYVDGGIGGGTTCQGNTPATPLVDAGCTHLVVSHLSEATLWDRHQYPDVQIIEIAIQEKISRDGGMKDLLYFDLAKSDYLIRRGYADTMESVGRVQALHHILRVSNQAEAIRDGAVHAAKTAVAALDGDNFDKHFGSPVPRITD